MVAERKGREDRVDNGLYDALGERWYTAQDHPIALLRAEGRLKNPWVLRAIREELGDGREGAGHRVLDVGCGGGFLANFLAEARCSVTAVDLSEESLQIARRHDRTGTVDYRKADATRLPFDGGSFDVACAMDFLEHVEDPGRVVSEVGRVLRPGGLFFFHTFNRNPASYLIIIKLVEWLVRNTPPNLHVHRLFIKPRELREHCARGGMEVLRFVGIRPVIWRRSVVKALFTGVVPEDFRFELTPSLALSYAGIARKH
jgi:2-polyprenyl-6-hydroxyphenyl methylase / 3-demethylubiquinone-9 3-methyltransferase